MTWIEIFPWGKLEIDDATGLPALPEGHFWRVRKAFLASEYTEVQIRQRGRIGSRRVVYVTTETALLTGHEHLLRIAAQAAWRFRKSLPLKPDLELFGDYPPKKLKELQ